METDMNLENNSDLQKWTTDRLQSFSEIETGWYGPESIAPSLEIIEIARRISNHAIKLGATYLGMVPTPEGYIEFEGIRFPNKKPFDVYIEDELIFAIYNDEIKDFEVYDEHLTEEEVLNRITLYSQETI